MARGTQRSRPVRRRIIGGVVAAGLLVIVGPFVYIHFVEGKPPAKLTLSPTAGSASDTAGAATETGSASASGTDVAGTWKVASGSEVGYRVKEVLFGQAATAVGRTSSVQGTLTVQGATVTAASFTVDMKSVASDRPQRDRQFNGRIMETSTYPTATFTLTKPIDLGAVPPVGSTRTFTATGTLTLHGVTQAVDLTLTCRRATGSFQVNGSVPITFADWHIANPSFGPVTTQDNGVLEFLLNFAKA